MQYLIYVYAIGAFIMLAAALRAMGTPMATHKEIQAMSHNQSTALGNFLGNLFALTVITAFWPVVAAVAAYKVLRSN